MGFVQGLMLIISTFVYAKYNDPVVVLLETSGSKRTISLDKGTIEGLQKNEEAYLIAKVYHENKRHFYKPIGKWRCIKVDRTSSVWISSKLFQPSLLDEGKKYFLYTHQDLMRGMKKRDYQNKKLVSDEDDFELVIKDKLLIDTEHLAAKLDLFHQGETIKKTTFAQEKNGVLYQQAPYKIDDEWGSFWAQGHYQGVDAKDYANRKRVHLFDKMMAIFLDKLNHPGFELQKSIPKRDPYMPSFQKSMDQDSYYARYVKEQKDKRKAKEEKLASLKKKRDQAWSAELSDDELSDLMEIESDYTEVIRRMDLEKTSRNNIVHFVTSLNLYENQNFSDEPNAQREEFDFMLSYERLMRSSYTLLRHFSLESGLRRSQDGIDVGRVNARMDEFSFFAQMKWYPFQDPFEVDTNIIFFGFDFHWGLARLQTASTNEFGDYALTAFPGLLFGVKYHFHKRMGVRFQAGFREVTMERVVRGNTSFNLTDRVSFFESKLGVGLSYLF